MPPRTACLASSFLAASPIPTHRRGCVLSGRVLCLTLYIRLLEHDFKNWYNKEKSINNSCVVLLKVIKHQPSRIFTSVTSWTAARYLRVIFAQEEKYAALITARGSEPWGNTSQHLPGLPRWKISTCWGSWLRWIVVFRVLDMGVLGRPPELAYNENHTGTVSLLRHLWVSRPRRDAKERSCTPNARGVVVVGGAWPFTNISADSNRAVGTDLRVCVCFFQCRSETGCFFFVCPCVFKCIQGCPDIALLLMYNIYV